ncbi:MAG: Co2+/Mg2+ efflux protein ApaG [Sulfuricellaceae bacterium]|jgi:ApaG protein
MAESKYEVTVKVHSEFIPEHSSLEQDRYVFAYAITITNAGNIAAQLISRHWIVTDANQQVQEVRGLGVVGEQPLLQPGESFEYTSGCVINTPVGAMQGSYQMVADDGVKFDAPIEKFILNMPRVLH